MTKRIKIRLAEPDDEIYSNGLIVGGTPLASSRKNSVPPESIAKINCYSMPVAHRLIDRFISNHHGENYVDWKPEIEYFVNSPEDTEFTIRAIGIVNTSGESHTYYFDVSQPMGASMSLVNAMIENKVSFLDRCFNVLKRNGE